LGKLYTKITFTNDTDSKIGRDKQNSQTVKIFTHIHLNDIQSSILGGWLMLRKMVGVVQKTSNRDGCTVVSAIKS
jgi:hypothetical protein